MKHQSLHVLPVLMVGCCFAVASGCWKNENQGSGSNISTDQVEDVPFLVIQRTPNYGPPGVTPVSGLVLAVWHDGTVMRASSQEKLTKPYVTGRLNQNQMEQVLQLVQSDHFSDRKSYVVPDAAANFLYLRESKRRVEYGESVGSFAGNSKLPELIDFIYAADISGQTSEFDGPVPGKWTRP